MLTYLADKFRLLLGDSSGSSTDAGGPVPENREGKEDCLPCRLISGFGLAGAGGYVGFEGMKRKSPLQKYMMLGVASGFVGLGVARLFLLPPFHVKENETSN